MNIQLHRVGKRPDWLKVPAHQRNGWQRLAAGTAGVITPANVTSIAGAALVGAGLWSVYFGGYLLLGLVLIAVGRIADILDGAVAQATGTKSAIGEAVDATVDKITVIAALIIFIATGILPLVAATLIGLRNGINIGLSLLAKSRRETIHPSRKGKLAGALEWTSLLLFIAAALQFEDGLNTAYDLTTIAAYAALALALLLGLAAIREYGRSAFEIPQKGRRG